MYWSALKLSLCKTIMSAHWTRLCYFKANFKYFFIHLFIHSYWFFTILFLILITPRTAYINHHCWCLDLIQLIAVILVFVWVVSVVWNRGHFIHLQTKTKSITILILSFIHLDLKHWLIDWLAISINCCILNMLDSQPMRRMLEGYYFYIHWGKGWVLEQMVAHWTWARVWTSKSIKNVLEFKSSPKTTPYKEKLPKLTKFSYTIQVVIFIEQIFLLHRWQSPTH